jgi:hypothetical protein
MPNKPIASEKLLDDIAYLCSTLKPREVAAEVRWMLASRIQAWSAERAPRGGETPLPLPDNLDRRITRLHTAYAKHIHKAHQELTIARRIERELTQRLTLQQAQAIVDKETGAGCCTNCGRPVPGTPNDRLRNDRCRTCDDYWRANYAERPRELIEKTI